MIGVFLFTSFGNVRAQGNYDGWQTERLLQYSINTEVLLRAGSAGSPFQNMAYGFTVGHSTLHKVGWYVGVMSNFNPFGAFKSVDVNADELFTLDKRRTSYLEGNLGLNFHPVKPLSLHLGTGYFYRTENYLNHDHQYVHLKGEAGHGVVLDLGLTWHIELPHKAASERSRDKVSLSADFVSMINGNPTNGKRFSYGFKLGIGICSAPKVSRTDEPEIYDEDVPPMIAENSRTQRQEAAEERKAAKAQAKAEKEAAAAAEREARELAEAKAKAEAEAKAKAEAEAKAKAEAEAKAKAEREAQERAIQEAEAKAKAEQEAREKAEREAREKAQREAEAKAKAEQEAKEKAEREAREKAQREAEANAKAEAEAKAKAEAEAKAKAEAEAKAKAEAEAKAKAEAEAKAKAEAEAKAKAEAEAKAKAEAEAKAKAEAEAKAKAEAEAKAKAEAEAKAKAEAEAKAKAEAEAKAKAEAEAKAKAEAEAKAKDVLIIDTALYNLQPESATIVFTNSKSLGKGPDIKRRGVCYAVTSFEPNPSLKNKIIPFTEGSIFQIIDSLNPETQYSVRAFTERADGTVDYSETVMFTTPLYLKTTQVSEITGNSAVVGGEILFSIPETITLAGACWSLKNNRPTTANKRSGDVVTNGQWRSSMLNLNPDTEYYVRTYVITASGRVYYGNVVTFRTGK